MKNRGSRKPSVGTRIIRGLQELADALKNREPLAEKFTFRRMELDLPPTAYDAAAVKSTRDLLGVSQAVFAKFLGVSTRTVRSWEQGVNTPSDMAGRFMDEIRLNPQYWVERLRSVVTAKISKAN